MMQTVIAWVLAHPVAHAAVLGFWGGFGADLHVFFGYRSWREWRSFDISTASYRWLYGAASAAALAAGWGQLAGLIGV